MIKRSKTRVNQKTICLRGTKRRIQETAINNGWSTHIFQILREIRDGKIIFEGNLLSILPKPLKLHTSGPRQI